MLKRPYCTGKNKDIKRLLDIETSNQLYVSNIWTGLRCVPIEDHPGHNWAYFIYLNKDISSSKKYETTYFPMNIMAIVSSYLNYIPAGCWNSDESDEYSCICGNKLVLQQFKARLTCSEECNEKILRNKIEQDNDLFFEAITYMKEDIKTSWGLSINAEYDECYIELFYKYCFDNYDESFYMESFYVNWRIVNGYHTYKRYFDRWH